MKQFTASEIYNDKIKHCHKNTLEGGKKKNCFGDIYFFFISRTGHQQNKTVWVVKTRVAECHIHQLDTNRSDQNTLKYLRNYVQ